MKKIVPIIILTITAVILIFYRFLEIPKNLTFDEVEFAKLALSLENKPYTPYSPLATGHSTLYFYLLLSSFKIFGINNFALRFPSAFFGVINVVLFYLIMKLLFKYQTHQKSPHHQYLIISSYQLSFILAIIFLTSRWYFNFARFAFEATFLLFLELTSIYFLILFWQKKRKKNLFLLFSGFFSGLAFNSYTPGRIFFLLPLLFLTLKIFNFKTFKQLNYITVKQLFIFLIPFLITITPLSMYLLKNKDIRFEQQFFLKNNQLSFQEKSQFLWRNIKSTLLMFHFQGDINGRHNYPGKPALNPILGVLFFTGLIIAIKNYQNPINLFFILYFLISILPTLLTYPWENPNMLRTFTVIPAVIYLIGVTISSLPKLLSIKKIISGLILFLIFFSSFYEIRTYFQYQAKVFETAFEVNEKLEEIINKKFL